MSEEKRGEKRRNETCLQGLKTSEILYFLRKNKGYTLMEIGAITATPVETLRNWSRERNYPSELKRIELIKAFCAPDLKPSHREGRAAYRTHGLTWDKSKKVWKLRLTIDRGPKIVGKRISQSMGTSDLEIAIEKRNAVVAAYQKLGLKLNICLHKRGIRKACGER